MEDLESRINSLVKEINNLSQASIEQSCTRSLTVVPASTAGLEQRQAVFVNDIHRANIAQLKCIEHRYSKLLDELAV